MIKEDDLHIVLGDLLLSLVDNSINNYAHLEYEHYLTSDGFMVEDDYSDLSYAANTEDILDKAMLYCRPILIEKLKETVNEMYEISLQR